MKGDEEKVVAAFSDWFRTGWNVRAEVDYVDVVAERDGGSHRATAEPDVLDALVHRGCANHCRERQGVVGKIAS